MTITFKAKVRDVYNHDDTLAFRYVPVPKIGRNHCDMNAFRNSKRFGGYANSDLFLGLIRRELTKLGIGEMIRLDAIPETAAIDTSGFLAEITITIPS